MAYLLSDLGSGGAVPSADSNFKNPVLAETWSRLLEEAEAATGREKQIEAARDCFYRGFIAEKIGDFLETAEVLDGSGTRHKAVLTTEDLAGYSATYEDPVSAAYHGWTVLKTGPWGQGPVLLQSLSLLRGSIWLPSIPADLNSYTS